MCKNVITINRLIMNYEDKLKQDFRDCYESAKINALKQSAIKTKKLLDELNQITKLKDAALNNEQWKPLLEHFNLLNDYLEQDEQYYADYCLGKLGWQV